MVVPQPWMHIESVFDDFNCYKGTIIGVQRERESYSLTVWFDDNTTEVLKYPEEGTRLIKDDDGNIMFNSWLADIDTSTFLNVS